MPKARLLYDPKMPSVIVIEEGRFIADLLHELKCNSCHCRDLGWAGVALNGPGYEIILATDDTERAIEFAENQKRLRPEFTCAAVTDEERTALPRIAKTGLTKERLKAFLLELRPD